MEEFQEIKTKIPELKMSSKEKSGDKVKRIPKKNKKTNR